MKEFIKKKSSRFLCILFSLVLVCALVACSDGDSTPTRERVTVTFDLGYEGGEPINDVIVFKNAAGGNAWPRDPYRQGFVFKGWKDSDGTIYTASTPIRGNVALTAEWEEWDEVLPQPPGSELEELFDPAKNFPVELSDSRKIWGTINPTVTFAFVADPVPMVYCHANPPCMENSAPWDRVANSYLREDSNGPGCDQCRLYIYGSNDTVAFNNAGEQIPEPFGTVIQGLRIISSDDLVNWTEHGCANFVAKNSTHPLHPNPTEAIADYANDTWAPTAEWRMSGANKEFFLYWCNSGNDTSVVISDGPNASPVGPWRNPGLRSSMINRGMPNTGSEWLFDPGTMIDHDGQAYMVLGGGGTGANPGNARKVMLDSSMYNISGGLETYNAPYMFEASDLWKWNGIYYLNYTTNWGVGGNPYGFSSIDVVYMMNYDGPMYEFPTERNVWGGPKLLVRNEPNGDSTSHGSLFDYRGKPYFVYHSNMQCRAAGITRMRTAHLLELTIDYDGTLEQLTMGRNSKPGEFTISDFQVKDFNPYLTHEAETQAIQGGTYTKLDENASNRHTLASIDSGDWVGIYGANFDKKAGGATKFNAIVKMPVTGAGEDYVGAIEIRLNPQAQGVQPAHNATLGIGNNQQTRITGGDVIGRIQLKADKSDEGKWLLATAELDRTVTGKHDIVFVFYSSKGAHLEKHNVAINRSNDERANNVGFEIDQWWFY